MGVLQTAQSTSDRRWPLSAGCFVAVLGAARRRKYTRVRTLFLGVRICMPLPRFGAKLWLWYSFLTVAAWAGWALLLKVGSLELPADATQFLATLGMLPVALALIVRTAAALEWNRIGIAHALAGGVLSAAGIVALIAAFRSGGPTGVITVTTGLYPMVTVLLAVLLLGERLGIRQKIGVGLAAAAILLFSW
jgi:uncharacterized membrane protein